MTGNEQKAIELMAGIGNAVGNIAFFRELKEQTEAVIKGFEELEQYRAVGTPEECKKSSDVRKQVNEIVNRQLIAGKNNYEEIYGCFYKIVEVIQGNY